jgi:sigma-B regulation protein RsbU (phosphoserine phosphatase)
VKDSGHESLVPVPDRALSPFLDGANEDRVAWAKLSNLQRRILPQKAPLVPGYHQVLAYRPAFVVTGDYHDFFLRPDGHTATFIGDGSGHGPAASMLMAIMRTLLHTHDVHREPGETLTLVGRMFHRLIPADLFMTGLYLLLGSDGQVSWSCAGHHPPLWVSRTGRLAPIDLNFVGHVLGISSSEEYTTVAWNLNVGDRLLVFTDGIWEARSPAAEKFGRQRLGDHLVKTVNLPLDQVVKELVAQVGGHLEGADFEDDFTVIGVERQE